MAQILDFPGQGTAMRPSRHAHRICVPAISVKRRDAASAMQRFHVWLERHRERTQMAGLIAAMPDETIADFAMTRAQMEAECRKPFWRA